MQSTIPQSTLAILHLSLYAEVKPVPKISATDEGKKALALAGIEFPRLLLQRSVALA